MDVENRLWHDITNGAPTLGFEHTPQTQSVYWVLSMQLHAQLLRGKQNTLPNHSSTLATPRLAQPIENEELSMEHAHLLPSASK